MLKQILTDMYIDPELLAELNEEQKQILFFKMREEQIRRWHEREAMLAKTEGLKKTLPPKKAHGKSVNWKLGADSDVWVWVMGEHAQDKPYDVICDEIMAKRARQLVQKEAEELRKTQEEELSKISETLSLPSLEDIGWKEITSRKATSEEARRGEAVKQAKTLEENKSTQSKVRGVHDVLADSINRMKKSGIEQKKEAVMKKHEEEIKRLEEERTQEIYMNWKETQEIVQKLEKEDSVWQESLRRSKAADERRRSIAKQARDDYKRLSMQAIERGKVLETSKNFGGTGPRKPPPPLPPKPKILPPEPKNGVLNWRQGIKRSTSCATQENIIRWFKDEQLPLHAGCDKSGDQIAPWFHGIISRQEAEDLLNSAAPGSFLIRVSEKIKGYVLSYWSEEGHKHFMIDASSDSYSFLGVDQLQHSTLADLVEYHKEEPITSLGKEQLLYPCGQQQHTCDYSYLFD
ncbi:SH2 domain-containing protein 4A [Microcaecilia unicolor]|uniref:SH2 domain-containing protein 4A n=1 Tax=Microcaecilia unicolor TaxID=1415580 RepID=A0A6P7X426_9AMPH|nr:SH2 domain-containing protein 4A [Microcaecilia unicolor]XP_030050363.1 SH2 domain-containing protein 4A [Microcaecilia unicolor]